MAQWSHPIGACNPYWHVSLCHTYNEIPTKWQLPPQSSHAPTQTFCRRSTSPLTNSLRPFFLVDVHYATKGIQGWPKIHLEVWHHDTFGRSEIYGYGFCHVPTSPGMHRVEVVTWRPVGTLFQQAQSEYTPDQIHMSCPSFVLEKMGCFKDQDVWFGNDFWGRCLPACFLRLNLTFAPRSVAASAAAYFVGGGLQLRSSELVYTGVDRPRLQTEAMGTVILELGVITHNFESYGVET